MNEREKSKGIFCTKRTRAIRMKRKAIDTYSGLRAVSAPITGQEVQDRLAQGQVLAGYTARNIVGRLARAFNVSRRHGGRPVVFFKQIRALAACSVKCRPLGQTHAILTPGLNFSPWLQRRNTSSCLRVSTKENKNEKNRGHHLNILVWQNRTDCWE